MKKPIVFFDTEVGVSDEKIHDIGAVSENGSTLHSSSVSDFLSFINKDAILCGHNIIHHDLKYIEKAIAKPIDHPAIDTLYLSPLLFPKRPYHSLLKDDKLQTDELNNPVNDSKKAMRLFLTRSMPIMNCLVNLRAYIEFFCQIQQNFEGSFPMLIQSSSPMTPIRLYAAISGIRYVQTLNYSPLLIIIQ